jgi:hypothetical protein
VNADKNHLKGVITMVENFVKISAHAADRMLERFGCERTDVKQSMAERAWKNGKTYRDYSGKASRFLYEVQTRHSENEHIVKTYSGKVFIFSTAGVLCTAFEESKGFQKLKTKMPVYREAYDFDCSDNYSYAA